MCSRSFVVLNVNCSIFRCVSPHSDEPRSIPPFIIAYMEISSSLDSLSLVEAARSWSFSSHRKNAQWKKVNSFVVVHFFPRYASIPSTFDPTYINLCWSELLLYCPFRALPDDIGSTDGAIVAHWEHIKNTYSSWHVNRRPEVTLPVVGDDASPNGFHTCQTMAIDEWKILSHLHPRNNIDVDDLDILSHRDFDSNQNWALTNIPPTLQETTIHFIESSRSANPIQHVPSSNPNRLASLSPTQKIAFNTILSHFTTTSPIAPLKMIIQGTTGT